MEQNGARVEDAVIPDGPYEEAAELVILIEAASAFQDLIQSGRCAELADPLGQINGYVSMEFSALDYLQVQRARTIFQKKVDALFDRFDVFAAPGSGSTARPLQPPAAQQRPPAAPRGNRPPDNTKQCDGISSLCGLPAITAPSGFSRDHLPYGLQFMGRALDDDKVIAAANLFQAHSDWHTRHPALSQA